MDKTTTTLPKVSRWRFLISKTPTGESTGAYSVHDSALMLSSFGYAFKPSMERLLPEPCSDVDVLNLSDKNELNMFKAVQANHNVIS